MTGDQKNSGLKVNITSFEVFIFVGLLALIFGIMLNLNVEISDDSLVRMQNMSNDDLKEIVYSQEYTDEIRINAYEKIIDTSNPKDLCRESYETLINSKIKSKKIRIRFEEFVLENPSEQLAVVVAQDFISKKLSTDLWIKILQGWYKVLLPQAFAKAQFIFKGLEKYDERNLYFVLDVMSQDNNSYIFEVIEKYFNQDDKLKTHKSNMKILNSLDSMKLNFADDVLHVLTNIILSNENSDDFTTFSGKIKEMVKKFAHTKDNRLRLLRSLENLNVNRWNSTRDELILWLTSQND